MTAQATRSESFDEMLINFVPTVSGMSLVEAPGFFKVSSGAPANVATMFLPPFTSSNDHGSGGGHQQLESLRRKISDPTVAVPSRSVQESALIGASAINLLDILVIGGGATGSGVALDASTRGLKVGPEEREDFTVWCTN